MLSKTNICSVQNFLRANIGVNNVVYDQFHASGTKPIVL